MKNRFAALYAAHRASQAAGNPLSMADQVLAFSHGRTASVKELSPFEVNELTRALQPAIKPTQGTAQAAKADAMRKGIIAIFYSMGRTVQQAKDWAEKQGALGQKAKFNGYTTQQLHVLLQLAKKIQAQQAAAVRTKLLDADTDKPDADNANKN